mmetsp:Transcript_25470/g.57837  ORF Transcript_25470/g.57837 Transcript_25470/m.57837 type:complete len:230 (+) Transcript_25470:1253-1942(+)
MHHVQPPVRHRQVQARTPIPVLQIRVGLPLHQRPGYVHSILTDGKTRGSRPEFGASEVALSGGHAVHPSGAGDQGPVQSCEPVLILEVDLGLPREEPIHHLHKPVAHPVHQGRSPGDVHLVHVHPQLNQRQALPREPLLRRDAQGEILLIVALPLLYDLSKHFDVTRGGDVVEDVQGAAPGEDCEGVPLGPAFGFLDLEVEEVPVPLLQQFPQHVQRLPPPRGTQGRDQ